MSRRRRPLPVRGKTIPCAWCGEPVTVGTTGRLPKWCSQACRQRAWVQRKAAESDRRPVEVVERLVEIEVEREVQVVERIEVPVMPKGAAWASALAELVRQLDAGRVYDRDLIALAQALNEVLQALDRRPAWRRRPRLR